MLNSHDHASIEDHQPRVQGPRLGQNIRLPGRTLYSILISHTAKTNTTQSDPKKY